MRAGSRLLSHPKFKVTRAALAAGTLAGLAIIGACSESPVASKVSEPTISDPRFVGVVGGNHHKVLVCVALGSDPGPGPGGSYTFTTAAASGYPYPWSELMTTDDDEAYLATQGITVNSDGPFSQNADNDVITTSVNVAPNECKEVFVRLNTCTSGDCDQPANHPGNRLWTQNGGVTNPYGAVNVTGTFPAGYSFTLSCTNDDVTAPINCVDGAGGYSTANIFHGSTFNYTIDAPAELPCPAGRFDAFIATADNQAGFPEGEIGDLLIKYSQFPAPNDNSYGANSVGWGNKGRAFKHLVNSDHAGVQIRNASNQLRLSFTMDYLTATTKSATFPSGYRSLGVTGGDGGISTGTATGIQVTTSLANNLNKTGYCVFAGNCSAGGTNLLVDSPPTVSETSYTLVVGSPYSQWDFANTYYARIKLSGAGSNPALAGFDISTWTVAPNAAALHNSPAKACPVQ